MGATIGWFVAGFFCGWFTLAMIALVMNIDDKH